MAEDLDTERGQYAGQSPQEIKSWTRAVTYVENAKSPVPLQKLTMVALPSLADLRQNARRPIAAAGSVGGELYHLCTQLSMSQATELQLV